MKLSISRILLVLVLAQFIIVIDTTFMNVSLSTLVVDLHTTVTGVQSAITMYALVMAALMIPGAKLGDIIGRKRAFMIGLLIYGAGTLITSLSSTLTVFMIGWSLLEGMGAALMLPAMMSLIADNFASGAPRSQAYAAFGATAGVAAALGPIIGGLFTTYLSWRLAFGSELLVVLYILSQRHLLHEQVLKNVSRSFDWFGFALSASGLVITVQGIVLASTYGFFKARQTYTLAGLTLNAGGISPTVVFVIAGLLLLLTFFLVETRRQSHDKSILLDVRLLRIRTVRGGSSAQLVQALVIAGVIFALSLYVQMQLNYSAIQSGLTLLPLSVGVIGLSAIAGRRLSKQYAPKSIMLVGFILVVLGALAMGLTARDATNGVNFLIGLLLIGSGIGCIVSQNQNFIISSVSPSQTNETSGIINTFQNIGTSLGTSIAGAIIVAVFISVATSGVDSSSAFSPSQQSQLDQVIVTKGKIVSNTQLTQATSSLPPAQQSAIIQINDQARQRSLTVVYYGIAIMGLLGVASVVRLPKTSPLALAAEEGASSAR